MGWLKGLRGSVSICQMQGGTKLALSFILRRRLVPGEGRGRLGGGGGGEGEGGGGRLGGGGGEGGGGGQQVPVRCKNISNRPYLFLTKAIKGGRREGRGRKGRWGGGGGTMGGGDGRQCPRTPVAGIRLLSL